MCTFVDLMVCMRCLDQGARDSTCCSHPGACVQAEFCPEGVAAGAPTPAGAMTPTPADSALPGSTTPGSTTPSPTDPDAAGTPDAPAGGETSGDAAPDSAVGIAGGALAAALSLAAFVAL